MAKTRFKQGYYKPKNPQKYKGDVNNVIYRSSWEKLFFVWADMNPAVLQWSSEEIVIPYVCDTDNKIHRYFVDAFIRVKNKDGTIVDCIVEIKPEAQTLPPKFPGKQTARYLNEVHTFVKNQSKWEAAKRYAEDRRMRFLIITEKELGLKK